jgi:hypothetical protein
MITVCEFEFPNEGKKSIILDIGEWIKNKPGITLSLLNFYTVLLLCTTRTALMLHWNEKRTYTL